MKKLLFGLMATFMLILTSCGGSDDATKDGASGASGGFSTIDGQTEALGDLNGYIELVPGTYARNAKDGEGNEIHYEMHPSFKFKVLKAAKVKYPDVKLSILDADKNEVITIEPDYDQMDKFKAALTKAGTEFSMSFVQHMGVEKDLYERVINAPYVIISSSSASEIEPL